MSRSRRKGPAPRWRLEFDAPANGRFRKATVTVIDTTDGSVKLTDKADMESMEEREKLYERLAGKLPGARLEQVTKEGEAGWNAAVQRRREEQQAREQAEAAASQAPPADPADDDPEADGRLLLAEMPTDVRAEAEALLRDPDLIDRVTEDVELQGVAGEKELVAALYLVFTSRKLRRPLAARLRGPSTSGKSHVIERTASLMPPEAVIRATQMTPQALFHMKKGSLRHKLIVAGERSRNEQDDAADATRALREMISAGRLSKLLPMKTGDALETVLVEQEGPIAFVESTTLAEVFAEDENRALPLYTDERPEQTRRIITALANGHTEQSHSGRDPERVRLVHHAAQRLLQRREVAIPFAPRLGAKVPTDRVEARRAFPAVLSMVQASAILHQFQREQTADSRLIAIRADYAVAALLLAGPMRRLLGGGISEPARRFAERLREWFGEEVFTVRQAQAKETTSRSSVYGWLTELRTAGLVEQVSESHGRTAATWQLKDVEHARTTVLPSVEEVFDD
jgi:hypothetical protein